jgi:hypothetical protein
MPMPMPMHIPIPNPPIGSSNGLVESSGSSPCNDLIAFLINEPKCASDSCRCIGSMIGPPVLPAPMPAPEGPPLVAADDIVEPGASGEAPSCKSAVEAGPPSLP